MRAKFTADITNADKKIGKLYTQYNYASHMKVLLRDYDRLNAQVERLPEIISDYEKSQGEVGKAATKRTRPGVTYRLEYEEMTGALRFNGITVHKCNINSQLNTPILAPLKSPKS